jgi:hypothetical protein
MADEQSTTLVATEDNVRLVLNALGAPITRYPIRGGVDWDEVERMYGPRFRDAKLFHFEGEMEYDDNSYYMDGEVYLIAAPDVADRIGEVVKNCLLSEIRRAPREQLEKEQAPIVEMYSVSYANYSQYCDDALLWQHGIVFAYRDNRIQTNPLDPTLSFTDEELEEVEEFFDL